MRVDLKRNGLRQVLAGEKIHLGREPIVPGGIGRVQLSSSNSHGLCKE